MKNLLLFAIIFIASISIYAQSQPEIEHLANEFSTHLRAGENEKAHSYFDEKVAEKLSVEALGKLMSQLEGQLGQLITAHALRGDIEGDRKVTYQPFQFEKKTLDLKLVFDAENKIAGIFFVPHQEAELNLTENDQFSESEIEVKSGKIKLRGILTLPKSDEKVPCVVLVHGSGPNDMDETIGPNKLFKDLAHGMAAQGIAVIRYDKRTKAYAGRPEMDAENLTLYEETIEDAISAVKLAGKTKVIDKKKIFVLGHSLGGMSAPRIGTLSKGVKGIIIMAGNARPLQDLVLEQYKYILNEDNEFTAEELGIIDQYEIQLRELNKMKEDGIDRSPEKLPLNLPSAYWKYLLAYDQVQTAVELDKPIFVVQGKRDYQVTTTDYDSWKESLKDHSKASFKLYDKLNHLMLEGEGKSYPSEYEIAGNAPDYLIKDLVNWIKNN